MIEVQDIAREIYESGKRLEAGSNQLFTLAKKMAETEREYRRALQIEIVKLKNDKNDKTPITLIPDISRGLTADLKFERDLAEARYKSAIQSLDAIKTQVNSLQSILKIQKEV